MKKKENNKLTGDGKEEKEYPRRIHESAGREAVVHHAMHILNTF